MSEPPHTQKIQKTVTIRCEETLRRFIVTYNDSDRSSLKTSISVSFSFPPSSKLNMQISASALVACIFVSVVSMNSFELLLGCALAAYSRVLSECDFLIEANPFIDQREIFLAIHSMGFCQHLFVKYIFKKRKELSEI